MAKQYYFMKYVDVMSTATKMEKCLLTFLRKYQYCVLSEEALERILQECLAEQESLIKINKRLKKVEIRLTKDTPEHQRWINVGNSYTTLEKVTSIEEE